jgi:serine/threonine protein kinase
MDSCKETAVLSQDQTCFSYKKGLILENANERRLQIELSQTDTNHENSFVEDVSCIPSSYNTASLLGNVFSMVHQGAYEIYSDELQFESQIGEGQFGLVYKGAWRGQPCAIKKLKDGISNQSIEYQRLLIELAILAAIGAHPNIVSFSGACIQDLSSPLIVEEFVDGMNLEEYLSRKSLGFNLGRAKVIYILSLLIIGVVLS